MISMPSVILTKGVPRRSHREATSLAAVLRACVRDATAVVGPESELILRGRYVDEHLEAILEANRRAENNLNDTEPCAACDATV